MTIDEAIMILTMWSKDGEVEDSDKLHEAENLALEALKRVKWQREKYQKTSYRLLPGETE